MSLCACLCVVVWVIGDYPRLCITAGLAPLASRLPLTFNRQQSEPVSGIQSMRLPASWRNLECLLFVMAPSDDFPGKQPNYFHQVGCAFGSAFLIVQSISKTH